MFLQKGEIIMQVNEKVDVLIKDALEKIEKGNIASYNLQEVLDLLNIDESYLYHESNLLNDIVKNKKLEWNKLAAISKNNKLIIFKYLTKNVDSNNKDINTTNIKSIDTKLYISACKKYFCESTIIKIMDSNGEIVDRIFDTIVQISNNRVIYNNDDNNNDVDNFLIKRINWEEINCRKEIIVNKNCIRTRRI